MAVVIDGQLAEVEDMPTLTLTVAGKDRRMVDAYTLDGMVRSLLRSHCGPLDRFMALVEEVGPMRKDGCVQAWAFSGAYHLFQGVVIGQGLPLRFVKPAQWKRDLKLRRGKDASRQRAMELFPAFRKDFARAQDDGRAEAALIGLWGHVQLTTRGAL